jgi:BolA protein
MTNLERLQERLQTLQPSHLDIEDDSHRHAGHAGAQSGGHFTVKIVSAQFAGKTTIQRHRLVYEAVGDLMNNGVHALSIVAAQTPDEAT